MKKYFYFFVKRIFDILCCIIALPFFFIIALAVGLAIKIEDHGPVFYRAERIGKHSRKFSMLKFRSMKVNADNILNPDGSTYNAKDDDRITKVGKFIRETSLDETPQIWNVLKGDMSIIGPRASGWEALTTDRSYEVDKMNVRPGITGYTQAYYRNGISLREKRLKDAWYANHAGLLLDIKIFFKSIVTVLKREGIYTNMPASKIEEKVEVIK